MLTAHAAAEAAGQLAAREKAEARVAELEAEVEKYKVLASQASRCAPLLT